MNGRQLGVLAHRRSPGEAYLQQMSRVFDFIQHVLLKDPRLCILF